MSLTRSTRGLALVVGLALSTVVLSSPRAFAQFSHVQFAASQAASGFLFESSVDRDAISYGSHVAESQLSGHWGCYLPESISDRGMYARESLDSIPLGLDDVARDAAANTLAIATFHDLLNGFPSGALGDEFTAARAALLAFDGMSEWRSPLDTKVEELLSTARQSQQMMLVRLY